jgi:hypothetical protein
MFIDLHKLIMHKAFLALLVSTGCAMMGDVPRMRFPQKRSNDISKVRETTNAEGFSCCFNEDCAARTVCSLTRAAHISTTGALLPKNKRDIRLNNLGRGLFMDNLLCQSCQIMGTK